VDIIKRLKNNSHENLRRNTRLATIDDYGNTYLNILQRPIVVEELKRY